MNNYLKIISLGGFADVTKNMYVYETEQDIILVDCGVGFPEDQMLGVDLVIPDVSYLQDKQEKIRAMFLSHGHEDHVGGLPYLLPRLPLKLPIYGPRWAKALVESKLDEFGKKAFLQEVSEGQKIVAGGFSVEFIKVTHSIPDTLHLVIQTPVGRIYHAADFKLDLHPVMGEPTNQELIKQAGKTGILCLLSDCLRSENEGFTPPEAKLEESFEQEIQNCPGKFIMTTMSSNISRLKQAIDVSLRHGRKIVLVGRSIEQNVKTAQKLGYLSFPADVFINRRKIDNQPDAGLTLLVAGSQGQLGSSLDRLAAGEMEQIKIRTGDKVIFSTDYIPGNESAIYNLVDNLYRLGAEVVYADIRSGLHVSGHGAQGDLGKLMEMVQPRYLIPIGGNYRHMVAYRRLAEKLGFRQDRVILPDGGQVVRFDQAGEVDTKQTVPLGQVMVDALGVGDVGNVVLRDRQILSEEGVVVAILPIGRSSHGLEGELEIVSRGFVYVRENQELVEEAKGKVRQLIGNYQTRRLNNRLLKQKTQNFLEEFFFTKTGRRPMVMVVLVEV